MQFDWHFYYVSNRTRTGAKSLFFLQGFRKTDAFLLLCGGSAGFALCYVWKTPASSSDIKNPENPGILKILILTWKRNPVCPLRLCWPYAGRAHTFGIAPKVSKNSRPLQCNSISRCTMLAIELEPEQKGCFSYKDSEKRTPLCSFAVDRPGCIVLCLKDSGIFAWY